MSGIKQSRIDKIILAYLEAWPTIMFAYRDFQYDFYTGNTLGRGTDTWRTIYRAETEEAFFDDFPNGWYPKSFDLEAFKAVAEKNYLMPLGEDH